MTVLTEEQRKRKNEHNREWYRQNSKEIYKRRRASGYNKEWLKLHPGYYTEYQKQWRERNREKRLADGRRYWAENREKLIAKGIAYRKAQRLMILEKVGRGRVECVRCGCDDPRLLEINHINGGGTHELKSSKFHLNIAMGRREIDDLEICCRLCNALHYVEMKYGKLPFRVLYERK